MSIDYDVIYRDTHEEPGRLVEATHGTIPADLDGTFLRNGPGMFRAGVDPVGFFDGYGFVATLGFAGGRAVYRGKYVQSPVYVQEQAAGRLVARRAFTNVPGGRLQNMLRVNLPNGAMHDCFHFGGRLYATDDPGYFELDPATLATRSEHRFNGRAPRGHKMAAVPRVDVARDRLVSYTVKPDPLRGDELTFLEMDRRGDVARAAKVRLTYRLGFPHEVAFTDRYFVVVEPPVELSVLRALAGQATIYECLRPVSGQPLVVHLVPRDGGVAHRVPLPVGPQALFHIANAYDDGDDVIVDGPAYAWPRFDYFHPPAARRAAPVREATPVFRRYRVRPSSGAVVEQDLASGVELPRIHAAYNGRAYRYAYLAGSGPVGGEPDPFIWAHEIVKIDVDNGVRDAWHVGADRFVSQPVFAPKRNGRDEDDGYVLSWLVNATSGHGEVVILDAKSMSTGPLATLDLRAFLGLASHCRFEAQLPLVDVRG